MGFIRSPGWPNNYAHDLSCEWTIRVSPGHQILLNVTDFDLETHRSCNFDYLEISMNINNVLGYSISRNGGYMTSPLIGRFCSNKIPYTIPSSSNELFLSEKGFEISWDGTSSGCGGHLISMEGSITSPGYPLPYHSRAECIWDIHVAESSKIEIVFTDLELEMGNDCPHDFVEIIDTSSIGRDSLGRFCETRPSSIISSGNSLRIRFRSHTGISGRGFQLHYSTGEPVVNVLLTQFLS
ncbi:Cubilinlike [Caligus rogercresseyi]|uniref:Cubilinlike n=1 Tax=Caligus rogercresseyi TaxID=217165 RepID=A0A7T8GQT5_CALRO|nr:Cubilinlike [Caligus rogercresseyi]